MKQNKYQPYFFFKQLVAVILFISFEFLVGIIRIPRPINVYFISYFMVASFIMFLPYLRYRLQYSLTIQKMLFIIPYYIPLINVLFTKRLYLNSDIPELFFWIVNIIIIFMIIFDYILLREDVLSLLPLSRIDAVIEVSVIIFGTLGEEMLFRVMAVYYLGSSLGMIVLSSMLFVYIHFLNRWANEMYSWKSYIKLFILSIALGVQFVYTKSIILPILTHMIFNQSILITVYKRTKVSSRNSFFGGDQ